MSVPDPLSSLRTRALELTAAISEASDEDTADRLADELDVVLDQMQRRLDTTRPLQARSPRRSERRLHRGG